jgi:isopentenyl-diphosphate delta-isomerase
MQTTVSDDQEMLDLVDRDDKVIGVKSRTDVYKEGLHNFRMVYCLLKNSKGELWIPRRTAQKRVLPNALAASMSGHVSSGESYELSIERELLEELKIDIKTTPHTYLGKLSPFDSDIYAFSAIYEIETDQAPEFNTDDFCEYFWMTPEEVIERAQNGESIQSDLVVIIKAFYA